MRKQIIEDQITFIQKGATINGHIESIDKLHISGTVIGNIDSKKVTVIHEDGDVRGDIITQRAEIAGNYHGEIRVLDLLHLKKTAKVIGLIITKFFTTEEGAQLNANVQSGKEIELHQTEETVIPSAHRKAG